MLSQSSWVHFDQSFAIHGGSFSFAVVEREKQAARIKEIIAERGRPDRHRVRGPHLSQGNGDLQCRAVQRLMQRTKKDDTTEGGGRGVMLRSDKKN
jgi:hypothetical protein